MITYVDTSTLLKVVVAEEGSDRATRIWEAADALTAVALIMVEARAALAAAQRGGRLTSAGAALCDAARHQGLHIANPLVG